MELRNYQASRLSLVSLLLRYQLNYMSNFLGNFEAAEAVMFFDDQNKKEKVVPEPPAKSGEAKPAVGEKVVPEPPAKSGEAKTAVGLVRSYSTSLQIWAIFIYTP